jgi:hypothetical protein
MRLLVRLLRQSSQPARDLMRQRIARAHFAYLVNVVDTHFDLTSPIDRWKDHRGVQITVASPRKRPLVKSATMAEHAHSPVASLGLPPHDPQAVDDDTLFGKMAASFLSSPAPLLEQHAPAAPVGDGNVTVPPLPLPLAVDDEDIFGCAEHALVRLHCRSLTVVL